MYLSVYGEAFTEKVIEKSRFLTYAAHTAGESEAAAFLSRVRAEHPQATHVCYAYVADAIGNEQRFSDAGEPQGTAGMPILGVLKAKKLCETAVAVVRYFGGIKLGAGGLTRAYSSSAAECCGAAEIREYDTCVRCAVAVGYSEVNALIRFAEREGAEYEKSFGERAEFLFAVRRTDYIAFCGRLNEFLNGRAEIAELERFVYPFPQK
ncbi:MAG: IMPACT family protein [Clostridia bacterium]|nr:IMPACT family protein [Clostridia bacterium]